METVTTDFVVVVVVAVVGPMTTALVVVVVGVGVVTTNYAIPTKKNSERPIGDFNEDAIMLGRLSTPHYQTIKHFLEETYAKSWFKRPARP